MDGHLSPAHLSSDRVYLPVHLHMVPANFESTCAGGDITLARFVNELRVWRTCVSSQREGPSATCTGYKWSRPEISIVWWLTDAVRRLVSCNFTEPINIGASRTVQSESKRSQVHTLDNQDTKAYLHC